MDLIRGWLVLCQRQSSTNKIPAIAMANINIIATWRLPIPPKGESSPKNAQFHVKGIEINHVVLFALQNTETTISWRNTDMSNALKTKSTINNNKTKTSRTLG